MSYLNFLLLFTGVPIVVLAVLHLRSRRILPDALANIPASLAIFALVLIALVYTTPWDNYLVANRVWWYDPQLVLGLTLGWVPLEEYLFFVLQSILVSLWLIYCATHLSPAPSLKRRGTNSPLPFRSRPPQQSGVGGGAGGEVGQWSLFTLLGIAWLLSVSALITNWERGTYLALELAWALPPIILQLVFGGDTLWRYRRLIAVTLLPVIAYLSAADAIAIRSGTWTINPAQSLGIHLLGPLPLEELIFFTVTSTLIVFGMVLALSCDSRSRLSALKRWVHARPPEERSRA